MCNPLYDSVKIIWAACIVETNDKKVATPTKIDDNKVETNNKKVATNTHHQKLIKIIEKLPDDQLKSAVHLLDTM